MATRIGSKFPFPYRVAPLDLLSGENSENFYFFRMDLNQPIFSDGFESGDTSEWSSSVP